MEKVVDGVFTFTGLRTGRVYLITEGDGLNLIDTSLPDAGPKILQRCIACCGRWPIRGIPRRHAF